MRVLLATYVCAVVGPLGNPELRANYFELSPREKDVAPAATLPGYTTNSCVGVHFNACTMDNEESTRL